MPSYLTRILSFLTRRALLVIIAVLVLGVWGVTRRGVPVAVEIVSAEPAASIAERGREVYVRYGCTMCHGPEGNGDEGELRSNPNSETEEHIPAVIYVAESYTKPELQEYLYKGAPQVGKLDPDGLQPPYTMPGWGEGMTAEDSAALVEYLWSLYPEDAADFQF